MNTELTQITLEAVVKTICKGDIIRFKNEHPECEYTIPQIINFFHEKGYNILNL